jgi:site-specific DNA recombinase
MSGSSSEDRPGLDRLVGAALSPAHPFATILVDDTSRLARNLQDVMRLCEKLKFARVRVVPVSQSIDTSDEQSDVLVTVHGLVDALYVKELAHKTHRGLEGKILRGLHAGSRVFGFRSVPDTGGCDSK